MAPRARELPSPHEAQELAKDEDDDAMVDVVVNAWMIFQQGQNVIRKAPYMGGEGQQGFYFPKVSAHLNQWSGFTKPHLKNLH